MAANLVFIRYSCMLLFIVGLWFVNKKVNRAELSFTLGFVWSAALGLGLLFVAVPVLLDVASHVLGMQLASNFLFLTSILFLVVLSFGLTLKDARHDRKVIVLAQELGLLRQEVEELRGALGRSDVPEPPQSACGQES